MSAVVENSFQITFVCSHEKSILYKNMVDPNKFVVGIVAAKKVLLLTIIAATTCLFFVVFLLIFYVRVFLSRTLTIHWTAEKGKVPSLFLWTTCMHKLKFRNVLTLLHLRLLLLFLIAAHVITRLIATHVITGLLLEMIYPPLRNRICLILIAFYLLIFINLIQ